jgi:amidase
MAWADDPERYVDAPISLQLVGRRYEDEKVIEALEMITEAAGLPFSNTSSGTAASKL